MPRDDLQAHSKCLHPYYSFLEEVTQLFMTTVVRIVPPSAIAQILGCIEDGLCSFDQSTWLMACAVLNNVSEFYYSHQPIEFRSFPPPSAGAAEAPAPRLTATQPSQPKAMTVDSLLPEERAALDAAVKEFFVQYGFVFKRILLVALQLIADGQFPATWSLSRPLLVLVLLSPEDFRSTVSRIANQKRDPNQQKRLTDLLLSLLLDVETTQGVSQSNRNRFTRNLYLVSTHIRNGGVGD
eukprot:Selendium_serpulae@DN5708_c1_g1_i3.p1